MFRALLFIAGVQLTSLCLLIAAVLIYNDRPGWWVFALLSLGFIPAIRLR